MAPNNQKSPPLPSQTFSSSSAMTHPKKPKRNMFALACAVLASMNSVLLGYDFSVMSGANIFIKEDLKLSDTKIEVLSGVINFFSLIGAIAAGRTSDWVGRRYTMVFASVFFFAGALLMGLAPNYAILMLGRFIAGLGVGYAMMIAPVYTAELAPTSIRGFLTSFTEVFINFGVLLGYVSNFAFAGLPVHLSWRFMFLAGAVPPIFLIVAVLTMPESPRWLVMQGQLGKAKKVLARTSESPEDAAVRLEEIKEAAGIPEDCNEEFIQVTKSSHGEGVWKELLIRPTPSVLRTLLACIGLQFFQQCSGIDSVVLYSPTIFEKVGVYSKNKRLGATVAIGFTKMSFILVATFLLDRVGRRPLLLSSAGGMIVSLLLLATGLKVIDEHPGQTLTWAVGLCIATVLSLVASFSIGLGPIAWVYSSEIFPLRLRSQGASLGTATNRIASGLVGMTFLSLYKAITISGSFFLYASIAIVGWVFFYVFLPETKGRSLEEMEVIFGKNVGEEKREVEDGGDVKDENGVHMG